MFTFLPMQISANHRRTQVLEKIRLQGFASLPDLAEEFGVSESTIRRDLEQLEESGTAKRTHGGVFYTGESPKLQHFDRNQSINWDKKTRIARAAAGLIDECDTLLMDGGSTTYELARMLVGRPLQVVTNSLPVANLFIGSPDSDLTIVGGNVHLRTGVSIGPYADAMLASLNCHRAILSVAAVSDDGFYNSNRMLVETEKAMMAAADEVIVVADSTKFGKKSLAKLCELNDVVKVVVDDAIEKKWIDTLGAAGVEMLIADK